MLDHQKTAEVRGMLLSSVLTMLPVLTYGALQSYLSIGPATTTRGKSNWNTPGYQQNVVDMYDLDLFKSLF